MSNSEKLMLCGQGVAESRLRYFTALMEAFPDGCEVLVRLSKNQKELTPGVVKFWSGDTGRVLVRLNTGTNKWGHWTCLTLAKKGGAK